MAFCIVKKKKVPTPRELKNKVPRQEHSETKVSKVKYHYQHWWWHNKSLKGEAEEVYCHCDIIEDAILHNEQKD